MGCRRRMVLILVLMEYGLWQTLLLLLTFWMNCLNPCSNGIWSLTKPESVRGTVRKVLILVLMEYGLWRSGWFGVTALGSLNPCSNGIWSLTPRGGTCPYVGTWVLILVLMEYGLWPNLAIVTSRLAASLNPCSNGIWSLTLRVETGESTARWS